MAESKMELEDWLDDLCVRFIINLPAEDLSSVARICFQVEEAQWFYEDFIRPLDPTLPSMTLRGFCLKIFQHCPLLASFPVENHMRAFEEFLQYKTRVPVRGAIMLNEAMDSTVLVKGWKKGANWSFPRGKINKDEDDLDCAIREVYEETGFDIRAAGLVPTSEEAKFIEINMREQQLRLYIFRNVPMDTHFEPKTRKEISKIEWYKLSELPAFRKKGNNHRDDGAAATNANKFYMVAPFLVPLKKWVVQQKKRDGTRAPSGPSLITQPIHEEVLTEDDIAPHLVPPARHIPAALPSAAAPAIDTFEGATRELQRLLGVQPPTQGAQPYSSPVADPGQTKGNALLAILQSGVKASGQPVADAQPQPRQYPSAPFGNPGLAMLDTGPPATGGLHNPPPLQPQQAHHQRGTIPGFQPGPQFAGSVPEPPQTTTFTRGPVRGDSRQGHAMPRPPAHLQATHNGRVAPSNSDPFRQLQDKSIQGDRSVHLGPLGSAAYASQGPPQANPQSTAVTTTPDQHWERSRLPIPQLNSHTMSLLSAFTSNSIGGSGPPAPANPTVPEQTSNTAAPSNVGFGGHGSVTITAPHPTSAQSSNQSQTFGDQHRNALLGMFKPQPQAPSPNDPSFVSAVDSEAMLPTTSRAGSATSLPGPGAHARRVPVRVDSTVNLPYGAVKLLSRSDGLASPANLNTGSSPAPSLYLVAHREHTGASPSQPSYANHVPAPQTAPKPPHGMSQQLQTKERPDSSAGQKHLLLSLFGRSQTPSQTPLNLDGEGKGKEAAAPRPHTMMPTAGSPMGPASRVATLASESGEPSGSRPTSRRESQAPISPADRNFLLGYLQSVTNGST